MSGCWQLRPSSRREHVKGNIQPPEIDQICQINAYLIRVHPLSGAKCFSELLGVVVQYCDLYFIIRTMFKRYQAVQINEV